MKKKKIVKYSHQEYVIHTFDELDSTNQFVKSNVAKLKNYTVIRTEKQVEGRGRLSRKWFSVPGRDLTFSLLLPLEQLEYFQWPNITQIAALSVVELLETYNIPGIIKWPNDVLVNGRKVCGILCESFTSKGHSLAVVGMGINVNSTDKDLAHVDQPATSLRIETAKTVAREQFLNDLVDTFLAHFNTLEKDGFDSFVDPINEKIAYLNEIKRFSDGDRVFKAKVTGINDKGLLIIEDENGIKREVISGEIQFDKGASRNL